MSAVKRCKATTKAGVPCRAFASRETGLCAAHDPAQREAQREASRKGGEARANARRAAKQWAVIGSQIETGDLGAMVKACMLSVKAGTMTPGEANAIAALAKTAVSISHDIELEARIVALEEAAGLVSTPANVRRIA